MENDPALTALYNIVIPPLPDQRFIYYILGLSRIQCDFLEASSSLPPSDISAGFLGTPGYECDKWQSQVLWTPSSVIGMLYVSSPSVGPRVLRKMILHSMRLTYELSYS